jgi:hypothetical protein
VIPEIDRIRTIAQIAAYDPARYVEPMSVQTAREVVEHIDAQAARITDLEQALRDAVKYVSWCGSPGSTYRMMPARMLESCIHSLLSGVTPSWPSIAEGVQ